MVYSENEAPALVSLPTLHNHYFVMRHGHSLANEAGIIISQPENGRRATYGLSNAGQVQVEASAQSARAYLGPDTLIYSSDFSRARQTAAIVQRILAAPPVHLSRLLRERSFGQLEGATNSHYEKVWAEDQHNPHHHMWDVESAQAVRERAVRLIKRLERTHAGRNVLLVSHGDTLQILQAAFEQIEPQHHRTIRHLETAEIRSL